MRRLGAAGKALIKSFEKLALVGYLDEGNVPTIGWGHTGSGVAVGMLCDEDEAEAWFEQDTEHAETVVDATAPLSCTQNQFDALVSFAYNVGVGAYLHSTLLTLLKSGNVSGATEQFLVWDHVDGQVSDGLLRRRQAERALFLS
jgi:lysozyme